MAISVFDLFTVGIGPSSSHTVGPMRAARMFAAGLADDGLLGSVTRVRSELFGSLGATGQGHGSPGAVVLGLAGQTPEDVDVEAVEAMLAGIRGTGRLRLLDRHEIDFVAGDLVLHHRKRLAFHANGMVFTAYGLDRGVVRERTYYSVGGGFVVGEDEDGPNAAAGSEAGAGAGSGDPGEVAHPFRTARELLDRTRTTGLPISGVMLANEVSRRPEAEVRQGLARIWAVMQACVERGCAREGMLPGGLQVRRRAATLARSLGEGADADDPLRALEWVTLYALAVNEENASGGRVVTAPTNGAAGILPAVLHYYHRFVPGADDDGVVRFLLTAGAVGTLFKENASISGAEVGCQGEVGSACSMAAAGLAEVLGGTPEQVENAAEIAMEHHLGLTCDPVGGLVQIPCIERNAIASVTAIAAARLALRGDGAHLVSLDRVIATMWETGRDMKDKYKETARGGLAVNIIEC